MRVSIYGIGRGNGRPAGGGTAECLPGCGIEDQTALPDS